VDENPDQHSEKTMALTSLDYQNTKQAPIEEHPNELIEGEDMSVHDERSEGIDTRTRGAVLTITVSVRKGGFRLDDTHIWAMFGGMGGSDDMMWS
jgi:hypothetical protein